MVVVCVNTWFRSCVDFKQQYLRTTIATQKIN